MGTKSCTDKAVIDGVEGKTPAPPLQPIPYGVQEPLMVQFVTYLNTINLTEAIFEFPFLTHESGPKIDFRKSPRRPLWGPI